MTEKKGTQSHICKKSVLNKIELQNIQQKIIIENNNQNVKLCMYCTQREISHQK